MPRPSSPNKDKARAKRLAALYNLTPEEYDLIFAEQGGVCAITGQPPSGTRLAVDHRHHDGRLRGLLSWKVNKGLSYFSEDPRQLRAAAAYLESFPADRALGKPRYGMIGRAKTGKRKTLYGSPNGPQPHRDLSR